MNDDPLSWPPQLLESAAPLDHVDESIRCRRPNSLTILPTYRCMAACKQCCFQSNPHIMHRVPQERLLEHIDQAAEIGSIRLVCFSEEESFLLGMISSSWSSGPPSMAS